MDPCKSCPRNPTNRSTTPCQVRHMADTVLDRLSHADSNHTMPILKAQWPYVFLCAIKINDVNVALLGNVELSRKSHPVVLNGKFKSTQIFVQYPDRWTMQILNYYLSVEWLGRSVNYDTGVIYLLSVDQYTPMCHYHVFRVLCPGAPLVTNSEEFYLECSGEVPLSYNSCIGKIQTGLKFQGELKYNNLKRSCDCSVRKWMILPVDRCLYRDQIDPCNAHLCP